MDGSRAGTNWLNASSTIHSVCLDAHGNVYAAGSFKNADGKYYVAKHSLPNSVSSVHKNAQRLLVYPNPANTVFTIELPEQFVTATLLVTDLSGKVIQSREITGMNGKKIAMDLQNTSAGTYIVQVITSNNSYRSEINIL